MSKNETRQLLKKREVARRFGVDTQTLDKYIASGRLALTPIVLTNMQMFDSVQVEAALAKAVAEAQQANA